MSEWPDKQKFMERVEARRRLLGFSRPEVSRRMGVKDEQYVWGIVRGLKQPGRGFIPKPPRDRQLARALGCSFEYLLGETEDESIDAADLVPATPTARRISEHVNRLGEADQKKVLGMLELATPATADEN